ncbi:hypothetical protein BDV27DRAFT_162130 [Aspergillus caelatus]|uniref:Uncharacterized protein n=1 Tax=Aspergillus caelatus TaxID=61420 RepID=A0A5N6ZSJ7_9EURO|nr:uncharacterized protein BDV27DRAFT_162130 [Aspergillus caelatus]KAE8359946.1 hypothetical protein BDV27DRAFT_162130 [Aspergillus caelatus]
MADNLVAPPAPQVAGGGGKPPGKRRQQERAGKRKRQKEKCRTCGESDHESEEHFEWTLVNAINALTGARQERLQAKRTASSASNNQVAPAAQEGGQRRKNKRGRRPPPQERRQRRQAAQEQQQQQRKAEQLPALALQAPGQEVDLPFRMVQQPRPHREEQQQQRGEGPQVLPQGTDEPPLPPPMEDTAMDVECCGGQELPALQDGDDSDL